VNIRQWIQSLFFMGISRVGDRRAARGVQDHLLDAARALSGGDPSSFNLRRWVKQPVGLFDREVLECPRLPSTTGDPVHIWANTVQGPASSSSLPSSSTINLHSLTRKLTFAPTSKPSPQPPFNNSTRSKQNYRQDAIQRPRSYRRRHGRRRICPRVSGWRVSRSPSAC
jgi:hypothetical protein